MIQPFLSCCSPPVPDRVDGGSAAGVPLPPPGDCLLVAAALWPPGPHRQRAGAGLWAEPAQPARVCQLQAHECAHRQGDPKKVKPLSFFCL
jgi:hypothetical protein